MNIKRISALLISITIIFNLGMAYADTYFKDINNSSVYYEAAEFLHEQGILSGMDDGVFAPDYPLSRPMIVTILWRLSGSPDVALSKTFKDVNNSAWYAKPVAWASQKGIAAGIGNNEFGININLTREQLMLFLYRYANFMGFDTAQGSDINLKVFSDYSSISDYALTSFKWAFWNNFVQYSGTNLAPKTNVVRGEAALAVYKFLQRYTGEALVENNTEPTVNDLTEFPEDYRESIAILEQKFPNWRFVPVYLDQDWSQAIKMEYGKSSLLEKSISSPLLLNKSYGFYTPSTGAYKNCDAGGWVSAGENAIEYYMDPRNFLNEIYIFQFELLSYDKSIHTKAGVEAILSGTYMHNSVISYIDKNGENATENMTYADAIMKAAEQTNTSPYYLASKIRQEVIVSGGRGSGSVSGSYGDFVGVYNFYNIGATDGANPIANGLRYASSGTTYMRPWNTPSSSIIGGAQKIAESFIAVGQDTTYFQRFDVKGSSRFVHQYMTSLTGAVSASYYTYSSYKNMGSLSSQKIFSIPVYQNMPKQAKDITLSFSKGKRTGTISAEYVNIRTGPGVGYDSVGVGATKDQTVNILGSDRISDPSGWNYVTTEIKYPYWYNVSYVAANGKSYVGYMCADYVRANNTLELTQGQTYQLSYTVLDKKGNLSGQLPFFETTDYNIASVDKSGKITAYSPGTVTVRAFAGSSMDSVIVTVK